MHIESLLNPPQPHSKAGIAIQNLIMVSPQRKEDLNALNNG